MDSSSAGATPGRKHLRQGSGRASVVRRTTKGPLDVNDSPLMTDDSLTPNPSLANVPQNSSQPQQLLSPTSLTGSQAQFSTGVPSPDRRSPRMPSPQPSNMSSNPSFKTAHSTLTPSASVLAPPKNFSYLQRPEIYHPLTLLDIPPPFRIPASQPDPTTPLATLLETGHFRSAAITAATLLASSNIAPSDHVQILNLLYTRLSCLTLCGQTSFAAQEVKALEDLNSAYYRDPETGVHLVLWELRVLAVRLQGMGFNDPRRGVMGYYDLAREARFSLTNLKKLEGEKEEEAITLWTERLEDLGIRVASALIEMDDLEGATKHLQSLRLSPNSTLGFQKALLWLFLGDIEAAKGCVSQSSGTENEKIIQAISYISDNEPAASIPIWEDLISSAAESSSAIPLYRQNLAVCYLYLGELASARSTLEKLIEEGHTFHALTFNLSTIYELCTEGSKALKLSLAEKVAGVVGEGAGEKGLGWEKVNGDFKL